MSPLDQPDAAKRQNHVLALVVERNPLVQKLEKFFLERAGYQVEFASDGNAALSRAQELRPAIVITEILVPKVDGLTLCRMLKSRPETKSTLILVFSHLEAEERAREAGADAFLQKPVNEEQLVETLTGLISRHQDALREAK